MPCQVILGYSYHTKTWGVGGMALNRGRWARQPRAGGADRARKSGEVHLVLLALLLALALGRLGADLLVVLLEGREVLTGLGELTLLHALTDVPVHEGALGVHQVELVVQAGPRLGDGRGVGQHAHGALHLGEVATRHDGRRLVVDADLEAGRAPVDELDGPLGLDGGDRGVDVLGDDVTTVEHAARHVLAVARVALDHLVGRLEAHVGDLGDRELLVVRLLGRDDRSVGGEREVDPRVRHQVGLELGEVDVERTIEPERGRDRRDDLGDEPVEVGVGRALDVEVPAADVVDGLVVDHERAVGVLEGGVAREDRVVRLDDGGRDLRGRVDGELELRLLAVVDREPLHEERGEARAGTATERVEDQETLETGALVGELADPVEDQVNNLLTDGVVTTGVVVGGVLLAGDQLLRVEELAVGTGADLVDDGGLEVDEDAARDVLAGTSLREEGVERVVATADGLVRGHLAVGGNAVLEAVELPAGVTDLATGLANVDGDAFTHVEGLGSLGGFG